MCGRGKGENGGDCGVTVFSARCHHQHCSAVKDEKGSPHLASTTSTHGIFTHQTKLLLPKIRSLAVAE